MAVVSSVGEIELLWSRDITCRICGLVRAARQDKANVLYREHHDLFPFLFVRHTDKQSVPYIFIWAS
jgi:hypothetical protein